MKLTFLFSVVLLNGFLYSQSVYDFTNQFLVDKGGRVHLKYNVDLEYAMNFDDTSYIRMESRDFVFNFQSETPKIYYEKAIYKFSEEKQIRVDIIMDTIILLEETFNNEVIRIGKVKKDTIYSTYNITVSNAYGEDSLVTDTMFHLIPIDYWMNDLDGIRHEKGRYEKGKKDGLWKTNLWLGQLHCISATLIEQQFENGKLITDKTIGYYRPTSEIIKKFIVKEWFGTGRYLTESEPFIISFNTTKNKCGTRYGQFNYLRFDSKTFAEKGYYSCFGNPPPLSGKWYIDSDTRLILGEYPFYVEYISETELLLENR